MKKPTWYPVSWVGYAVLVIHALLCIAVLYAFYNIGPQDPIFALYNGAGIIYGILLAILLIAKLKRKKLFRATRKHDEAHKTK